MGNIVDKKNGQETRLEKLSGKIPSYVRLGCFVLVIIVYAVLFARMSFTGGPSKTEEEPDERIFKLVDVQEYVPQEKTIPVQNRNNVKTEQNVSSSEKIIEKDKIEKIIEAGDLKLDCEGRRLYISGNEINLTAKEFDVLELLVLNPNKVYSRDNLLKIVWGADYPGDVRTVDVHIRRLREKVEENPGEPKYVHTKWGVGYYFA